MAYAKNAAVTTPGAEEPANIAFTFSKAEIFDNVSMQSNYMTKNIANNQGAIVGEEYSLSGDDEGPFQSVLGVVMSEVFEIFQKQTQGIANSYSITGKDAVAPATPSTITIKINDHAAYNANVLDLVDLALRDCIQDGCLRGWFTLIALENLIKISDIRYKEQLERLKKRLFDLKKRRAFESVLNG